MSFIPADATHAQQQQQQQQQQQTSVKPTTNAVVVMGMPSASGAPSNNVQMPTMTMTMTMNSNVAGQVPNASGQISNVGNVAMQNIGGVLPNVTVVPNVGIIGNGVPTAICNNMQAGNSSVQPPVPTMVQNTLASATPNGIPTMISNSGAMAMPNGLSNAVPNAMHGLVGMLCLHLLHSFACIHNPYCPV
jgi:hypothetical protein